MTGTDPNAPDPSLQTAGDAERTEQRPRRIRWSVAAMTLAGLLVAGSVGGVVAESVSTDAPPPAASSPTSGSGSPGEDSAGNGFSAQTVADPDTLAERLDHVHDGISLPDPNRSPAGTSGGPGSSSGSPGSPSPSTAPSSGPSSNSNAPGAEGTPVDAGVEVQDAPGVLLVNTETSYGEGSGTGMVVSADGLALTNYHVVDGSSEVEVTVGDTGETATASVVGRDAAHDVAVLQLQDASGLETISIDSSGVDPGEEVAAVGNGSGQGYLTAVSGGVTGVGQSISAERLGDTEGLTGLIGTDADVVPGYSGGPLVDDAGQVVGMSTAASTGETSEQVNGFAIEITEALGIADQIVAGTESDSVQIGASGALGITVTDSPAVQGALVVEAAPGSAAETAGLTAGDTVTSLDGTAVADSAELSARVNSLDPGDTVSLTWTDTDGAEHTDTVELGKSTVN